MQLLPAIVAHAKYAFRREPPEAREDLLQEVIANALVAFVALVRRGKMDLAFGSVLAKYAVAQIKDGRRVGNKLRISEVLSAYAQQHKGFSVSRLDKFDEQENAWEEVLVEDRTAGPAEIAMARIDFDAWMKSLTRRDRRVAEYLSLGNRTSDAARKFRVSQGRVSQLRRELADSWKKFTGGNEANAA